MTRDEAVRYIEAGRVHGIPDEELITEVKMRSIKNIRYDPVKSGSTKPYVPGESSVIGPPPIDEARIGGPPDIPLSSMVNVAKGIGNFAAAPIRSVADYISNTSREQKIAHAKFATRAGLSIGGAYVGGPAGARAGVALSASPVVGNLLGQAAGVFAGDALGQKAYGEDINWKESAIAAGTDLGLGGLAHGIGYGLARGGGIASESIEQAALRPKEILKPLVGDEYANLSNAIADDLKFRASSVTTPGRRKLTGMMDEAEEAGVTLDPRNISTELRGQVQNIARPEINSVNKTLKGHAGRFDTIAEDVSPKDVVTVEKVSPSSIVDETGRPYQNVTHEDVEIPRFEVTPREYDSLVRNEMTAALKKYNEQHGGKLYLKALAKARKGAQGSLYGALGGEEARAAGMQANRELRVRERVEGILAKTKNAVDTSSPEKLRAALNPSNVGAGINLQRALKAYDKQEGTKWYEVMQDLSMRERWNPLDTQAAGEITAFIIATGYRNRSLGQRAAVYLGKGAIKAGVPAVKSRSLAGTTTTGIVGSRENSDGDK